MQKKKILYYMQKKFFISYMQKKKKSVLHAKNKK